MHVGADPRGNLPALAQVLDLSEQVATGLLAAGLDLLVHDALKRMGEGRQVSWLSVDKVNLSGTLLERPSREDIPTAVEEHLIVELYSK